MTMYIDLIDDDTDDDEVLGNSTEFEKVSGVYKFFFFNLHRINQNRNK